LAEDGVAQRLRASHNVIPTWPPAPHKQISVLSVLVSDGALINPKLRYFGSLVDFLEDETNQVKQFGETEIRTNIWPVESKHEFVSSSKAALDAFIAACPSKDETFGGIQFETTTQYMAKMDINGIQSKEVEELRLMNFLNGKMVKGGRCGSFYVASRVVLSSKLTVKLFAVGDFKARAGVKASHEPQFSLKIGFEKLNNSRELASYELPKDTNTAVVVGIACLKCEVDHGRVKVVNVADGGTAVQLASHQGEALDSSVETGSEMTSRAATVEAATPSTLTRPIPTQGSATYRRWFDDMTITHLDLSEGDFFNDANRRGDR